MSTRTKPPARRGVGRPGDGEDVRGAILAAALRQLEATGSPDRVTVAAIVNEAGCTPPSLYHYWPKRELLLQEASERGWAQFRASQSGAVADHRNPVKRLRLRGRAYLDFSLAKPALFRVLFLDQTAVSSKPATQPHSKPPTQAPAQPPAETGDALRDLVFDVTAAMATGRLRAADPLTTALALWAAMHGVAALWAVTPSLPTDLAHAVGDLAQDAVLAGLARSVRDRGLDS
ncbi:MAG TPA: TetR/AcrR family transcriptional regulator [Dermatophilaceae bacterium]